MTTIAPVLGRRSITSVLALAAMPMIHALWAQPQQAAPTTALAGAAAGAMSGPESGTLTASAGGHLPAADVMVRMAAMPARHGVLDATMAGNQEIAQLTTAGNLMHLMVNRSVFINAAGRVRKIYVSNPDVVQCFTASPSQIVITAKQPGMSTLVLWNEEGESKAYSISSDVDTTELQASLNRAFPDQHIVAESHEARISLMGDVESDAEADAASKLAAVYSKDVASSLVVRAAHIRQVKLRVRFVEVDRSKLTQFGFNFFSAGGNNLAATSTNMFPVTTSVTTSGSGGGGGSSSGTSNSAGSKSVSLSDPLNFLFYSSALNVGGILKDLEDKQVLEILAEPTITAVSGQKANFLSGGEFPFPVVQGGTGGFTSVTVQFRPYGVKLEFTPLVNPDGTIYLKVAPEVSALDYTNSVTISGYTIPALSTRRAETQVELKNGQSFAISGLLDRRTTDAFGRTPGIASIPILGQLFKSKNFQNSTTDLIVVVTPEIVDPLVMAEDNKPAEPKIPIPMMDPASFDPTVAPKKK